MPRVVMARPLKECSVNTNPCAICGTAVADTREHVWPQWYLGDLDELGPPSTNWSVNGLPVLNRHGVPVGSPRRQRVVIPACGACNTELDRRFEKPAKDAIRRQVNARWRGSEKREDWRAIGLWWVKILLLLGNPLARHEHPRIDQIAVRFDSGQPDYAWMINGGSPPKGLSLWVFNGTLMDETQQYRVPVPRAVISADGSRTDFHFMMLGTEGLCVTLLSHPGWPVEHPLVQKGHAWELLHSPPEGGDLSSLPMLGCKTVAWTTFLPTLAEGVTLGGELPPLRHTDDWPATPEVMDLLAACEF
jgi:hypothetical protein